MDTDASGRIHFSAMFRYFEAAEVEFLRTLGITYEAAGSSNFPRVHVECDFLQAIGNDDVLEIDVSVTKVGRSSVRFQFRTLKQTELASKGIVVAVCADRKAMRSVSIPDNLRAKLLAELSPSEPMAV